MKLHFLTILCWSSFISAQLPNFTNTTWYLEKVTINNVDYFTPQNSEVQNVTLTVTPPPPNVPWSIFRTDMCGYRVGTLDAYYVNPDRFSFWDMYGSNPTCTNVANISFEETYFNFFTNTFSSGTFLYSIVSVGNGLKLSITNVFGNTATYYNYHLKTNDVDKKRMKVYIYPNPVKELINIEAKNIIETKIYDPNSILIIHKKGQIKNIDISNIANGIYFLEVRTDTETIKTKIIKE